jgi:hypothetical protein
VVIVWHHESHRIEQLEGELVTARQALTRDIRALAVALAAVERDELIVQGCLRRLEQAQTDQEGE